MEAEEQNLHILENIHWADKDRSSREELPWFNEQEQMLSNWMAVCLDYSKKHAKIAKYNKLLHRIFSLIAIIFPLATSALVAYKEDLLIIVILVALTGVVNGVLGVFKFEATNINHDNFASKYETLQREIMNTLIIPRKFRPACDVTIKYYQMKLNHYTETAPDL